MKRLSWITLVTIVLSSTGFSIAPPTKVALAASTVAVTIGSITPNPADQQISVSGTVVGGYTTVPASGSCPVSQQQPSTAVSFGYGIGGTLSGSYSLGSPTQIGVTGVTTPTAGCNTYKPYIYPYSFSENRLNNLTNGPWVLDVGAENSDGSGWAQATSSFNVQHLATNPDYTISCSPNSRTVPASGGTATYTATITSLNNFSGSVTVNIDNNVALYPSWSISPPSTVTLSPGNPATVSKSITIPAGATPDSQTNPTGSFTVSIQTQSSLPVSHYCNGLGLIVGSANNALSTIDIKANGSQGPINVNYNTAPTISWTSETPGDTCYVSVSPGQGGDAIGSGGSSGSFVAPAITVNSYYILNCQGYNGNDVVYVNVSGSSNNYGMTGDIDCRPRTSGTFTDGPCQVAANDYGVIRWDSTGATSCTVLPAGFSGTSSSGVNSYPVNGSATYTLRCTNSLGTADLDSTMFTNGSGSFGSIECQLANGTYSYGPCTIVAGTSTYVTWGVTGGNFDSCSVQPLNQTGFTGTSSTGALYSSQTYTLGCTGGDGSFNQTGFLINGDGSTYIDSVVVNVVSADLKISATNGNFTDGPLNEASLGTIYLNASCPKVGGSGRISPGNVTFNGTSWTGTANFNTSPKTWTLTCYPSANQVGTPTATDYVTAQQSVPDFNFVCNTLSKTVIAGSSTVFDTTATATNGFNSSVTVSVTAGLPAGASSAPVTITPAPAPGTLASVPVSTQVSTPAGTYNLTFTASGGSKTHTCTAQLTVTDDDPTVVSLTLYPTDSTILVGGSQDYDAFADYSDGTTNVNVTASTTFNSSNDSIAEPQPAGSNHFVGQSDGTITVTGTYTEGIVTVADTADLTVGDKGVPGPGSLSASLTCPSGGDTCNVSYNTPINLTWTSTGAEECSIDPDLTPTVGKATSGTSSTGNLTNPTNQFTLTCIDSSKTEVTDVVTVTVTQQQESFVNADKDITAVNGSAISNTACNGGTDSIASTFSAGDLVSFKINLCNSGTDTAANLVVTDQLTNLSRPTAGWNAMYNGSPITPTESGAAPNKILTFTIPGSINVGQTRSLTFDAVVTTPSPATNTIYRFQNIADISNANDEWRAATPLFIFYAGSKVPSKQEVAP